MFQMRAVPCEACIVQLFFCHPFFQSFLIYFPMGKETVFSQENQGLIQAVEQSFKMLLLFTMSYLMFLIR